MEFLADQYDLGLQYRSINTLHSALSTTHPQVDEVNVGSHPLVQRLLKGIFNSRPSAPRYNGTWDVSTVVEYLRSCCTDELSILDLGRKVVTLMALANADRCSDLAALDRDYLRWTPSGVQFTVVRLTKRTVHYLSLSGDVEVCPGSSLRLYLSKTAERVCDLSKPKSVFLTSRKPFRGARPGTLGHYIKDILKKSGINTDQFSAHSTRSASTSQACAKGVPMSEILKVANWSSGSVLEQFYHRNQGSTAFTRAVLQPDQSTRYVL